MKKLLLCMLTIIFLIVNVSTVLAATMDNNDFNNELEARPIFSLDEIIELFPEANLDEEKISRAERNYKRGILLDAMDINKSPVESYENRIADDVVHYLNIYEDGSFVIYGLLDYSGIYGGSSYIEGSYLVHQNRVVYWQYAYYRMEFRVTYRQHVSTGYSIITNAHAWYTYAIVPVSVSITQSSQSGSNPASARMLGNAMDEYGNQIFGMRLRFNVLNGVTSVNTYINPSTY